jgi:hypothetical protein
VQSLRAGLWAYGLPVLGEEIYPRSKEMGALNELWPLDNVQII